MRAARIAAVAGILIGAAGGVMSGDAAPAVDHPGALGRGVTLLPNGWKISPAGWHVPIGDLPLAMVESPDGKYLLVSNNGYAKPSITVFDETRGVNVQRLVLDHAWVGMAWHPDGRHLYVSGAGNNTVHELTFNNGRLVRGADLVLGRSMDAPGVGANRPEPVPQSFIGGVAVSPDGARLFAVHVLGQMISMMDLKTGHVLRSIDLPAEPYTCVVSPDGSTLFVSLWGGAKILLFDAKTLDARGEIAVGEHPNSMILTKDGKRLFVACANTNAVWAIDVENRRAVEQIAVAMYPNAPAGSTPNSASLSPDEKRLLVANADNNTVAVINVEKAGQSQVEGFIPTGWYPTGAMFTRDGSRILVLSGKGLSSSANPRGNQPGLTGADGQYIGGMLQGTLSIVGTPDASTLTAMTTTARAMSPYSDAIRLAPANAPAGTPVPRRVGDPSPIKHVYYVIRENRTYDQIFGDVDHANGDPTLCLFGDQVTPNAHALVREFGVLDNFYVDAEVSYDGHAFSTGAYATDVVEKFWPTNYASRGAAYLSEGGGANRNAYGNVAAPLDGYIWDACVRKHVSVRSFGEFVHVDDEHKAEHKNVASVPGLEGRFSLKYPPWDLKIPDGTRADVFIEEFHQLEASGELPSLSVIRLGNDHTGGTNPIYPTPRAMIAENDLALGRIVEAISHSASWKESAIFVLEDDAQNGPDHVDAHRSPALVISPFSKRHAVDSTLYTTSGLLRTMELLLGLPPMSQYDAAATPMYTAFQATPVLAPFTHLAARIPLDEKNERTAFGAEASMRMNLAEADLAPEQELNEILWRSVKGPLSVMPPITRSAWIRPAGAAADPDDR